VRSFFLNQVDGLSKNDGILMVGSTNHLDRLDPGISKRPSRFDRKYLFPNPTLEERTLYAEFWRNKLLTGVEDDGHVDFPRVLCKAVAGITKGFSFAYMQEAFVAALLAIANEQEGKLDEMAKGFEFVTLDSFADEEAVGKDNGGDKDLDQFLLWRELKKQIKVLREDMDSSEDSE